MYCNFFGLSERPFDAEVDARFLYLPPGYEQNLAALVKGIQTRCGLMALVGEFGVGKTTLLDRALDLLGNRTKVARISGNSMNIDQILQSVLVCLEGSRPPQTLSRLEALRRLKVLAANQGGENGNVVLVVDEAHYFDSQSIENLGHLFNLREGRLELIQIVLCGQPKLESRLAHPGLKPLHQRLKLKVYINPFSEQETYEYIAHRLRAAGYQGDTLFTSGAQRLIWEYSGGIPGKINPVCDHSLLIGYGMGRKKVGSTVVQEAVKDLGWRPFRGTFERAGSVGNKPSSVKKSDKWVTRRIPVIAGSLILAGFIFSAGIWVGKGGIPFLGEERPSHHHDLPTKSKHSFGPIRRTVPPGTAQTMKLAEASGAPKDSSFSLQGIPGTNLAEGVPSVFESSRDAQQNNPGEYERPSAGQIPPAPLVKAPHTHALAKKTPGHGSVSPKTVETPPPTSSRAGPSTEEKPRLVLQVAAFRTKKPALRLTKRLRKAGYDAYTEKASLPRKGIFYRVRLRCCQDQGDTQRLTARIREQGFGDPYVVGPSS